MRPPLRALLLALCVGLPMAVGAGALPTLMSTNICADTLALSLAAPQQILSLSRQSQDAQRFSLAAQARQFPANEATAEDVLHLQPQVVLASRRWNARHQTALLQRHGVQIVTVPFPTDWEGIFSSTRKMGQALGREAAAQALLDSLSARLAQLRATPRPFKVLYLRPNGGSAGAQTHVDAVLTAAGLRNHASALGLQGWGRIDLERIVQNPPDIFITPGLVNDAAYARSGLSRHPQMQKLLQHIPVVVLQHNDWGCSNWQLIEAAESVAAQIDALPRPAARVALREGGAMMRWTPRTGMPRVWLLNTGLLALLLVLAGISLGIGSVSIGVADWWAAAWQPAGASDLAVRHQAIVQEIRLPRVVLAVLVGMSLGVAGAALQGLLRNPLAEPGLLGVSSSAGLGAVLCIYFGLWHWNAWLLPTVAMASAAAATLVLYRIASRGASNLTLILAGVAMSSLMAALTSLAINLAPTPTDMQDIVLWLMGSLADRSFDEVRLCLPFIALGLLILAGSGRQLDALTLGEDEAASMGVNLPRLRAQVIAGTALCVGASVAVTGSIGFIGLVVPHLFRSLVGYRPSRLLLPSALGGAVLLLGADIALRLLGGRVELMLGVVTALIGAPFFFYLVVRERWRHR